MSYRDLRNFTEMTRSVGYKRIISLESFKNPNFDLMADVLQWFVLRFDPDANILRFQCTSCSERVNFINFVSTFMLSIANIKVNPKKLYEANGRAVKELLKIVHVLCKAQRLQNLVSGENYNVGGDGVDHLEGIEIGKDGDSEETDVYTILSQLSARKDELYMARKLSKELSETAANLYFSLAKEADLNTKRVEALNSNYDITKVDAILDKLINETKRELVDTMDKVEQTTSDATKLDSKFESKVLEMERCLRRFETLRRVRPVYQEEFNCLEEELSNLHSEYLEKFRNVSFLEDIIERYGRHEKENREMNLRLAVKRKKNLAKVVASASKSSLSSEKQGDDEAVSAETSDAPATVDHLPVLPYRRLDIKSRSNKGIYFGPSKDFSFDSLQSSLVADEDEDEEERLMFMMMKNLRDAGIGVMCDEDDSLDFKMQTGNFRGAKKGLVEHNDPGIYLGGSKDKIIFKSGLPYHAGCDAVTFSPECSNLWLDQGLPVGKRRPIGKVSDALESYVLGLDEDDGEDDDF